MKTRSIVIWVIACVLIFMSTQAFAIDREFYALDYGNIKIGKFTLIPGLSVQSAYDDNVYLASGRLDGVAHPDPNKDPERIVKDWLTYVKPAFGLEYEISGRGKIDLGYQGTLTHYSDQTENNWQNHQAMLGVNYEAPSGFIFKLSNDFNRKEDPYGDANNFNIGQKGKRWQNVLKGDAGLRIGESLKTMLYYGYEKQVYDKLDDINRTSDFMQDYQAYEGGVGVEGKVMPKTWAFLRGYYRQHDYDGEAPSNYVGPAINGSNDADYNRTRFDGGLSWDGDSKLSGELNLGWAWYNFKNEFDATLPTPVAYQDQNTWVAFTSVTYQPTETTGIAFNLNRDLRSSGAQTMEFFIDSAIGVNITQKFMDKLEVFGGLTYGQQAYNTNDREDRNIQLDAELTYFVFKWLSCGLQYSHQQKESSSNSAADQQGALNEYSDNRYTFKVTAVY